MDSATGRVACACHPDTGRYLLYIGEFCEDDRHGDCVYLHADSGVQTRGLWIKDYLSISTLITDSFEMDMALTEEEERYLKKFRQRQKMSFLQSM